MELEYLQWDSAFFGFKTGKIQADSFSDTNLCELIAQAKLENYHLLYLWLNQSSTIESSFAQKLGANLVDTKITFQLNVQQNLATGIDNAIVPFNPEKHAYAKLQALGIISGVNSRFKIDPKIPNGKFEAMYNLWIENSVNGKIANEVLVYAENDVLGFVTLAYKNDVAKIGLIGVDAHTQGKGVGSKLLAAVAHKALQNNCSKVIVPTQKANELACKFYLKNGYTVQTEEDILHLWL